MLRVAVPTATEVMMEATQPRLTVTVDILAVLNLLSLVAGRVVVAAIPLGKYVFGFERVLFV
jgi:hypothetical protein